MYSSKTKLEHAQFKTLYLGYRTILEHESVLPGTPVLADAHRQAQDRLEQAYSGLLLKVGMQFAVVLQTA